MFVGKKIVYGLLFFFSLFFPLNILASNTTNIAILCYHNLNPVKPGMMNLTPKKLESQIQWLKANGFNFISLKEAVAYLQDSQKSLPPKSIVITLDDGWSSVYTYMLPIAQKYKIPVTLFIYPQTISKGKNALTWDQLKEMQQTGLFDIQSHTYSHPNFKIEKRHLSPEKYANFVKKELANSKKILEEKLGTPITLLAWPFGIYDDYLKQEAAKAGYTMAFSIDATTANKNFNAMAQPRFMILEGLTMKGFIAKVNGAK